MIMDNSQDLNPSGLASSYALSWKVWLFGSSVPLLVLSLFGNFGSVLNAFIATLAAVAVSAPVFLFSGIFLLPRVRSKTRRVAVVVSSLVATSALISVSITLLMATVLDSISPNINQVVPGIIFHTWFYILTAFLVSDRDEYVKRFHRLSVIRAQLEHFSQWSAIHFSQSRKDDLALVAQQISQAQNRIASSTISVEPLRGMNNDIIGSLLNEISSEQPKPELVLPQLKEPRASKRTLRVVFKQATTVTRFSAFPASVFIASTWVATGLSMENWTVTFWASVASSLSLYFILRVLSGVFSLKSTSYANFSVFLTLLSWFVSGFVAALAPVAISGLDPRTMVAITLQTFLVIAVISVIISYRQLGTEITTEIERENERFDRILVTQTMSFHQFREKLRSLIHGKLQTALIATERKLLSSSSITWVEAEQASAELELALNEVAQNINGNFRETNPWQSIEELQAIWGDALNISSKWESSATDAIQSSLVTRNILSEIVIEAVTNTAKHDLAHRVELRFMLIDDLTLQFSALSSGPIQESANYSRSASLDGSRNLGNGHRLFNEVCMNWTLVRGHGETLFTADIPVIPDAQ